MNLIFLLLFYFNFIQANIINPTTNTTNQTIPVSDVLIVLSDEKNNSSINLNKTDELLNALPSISTLTKLTLTSDNQIKNNKNTEIQSEVRNNFIHKSIPIQRGIIKSRPLAGVKASSYQLNEQVKDVKSDTLDDLSTERSTMIASTRTAPLSIPTSPIASSSTTKNLLTSNSNQFKQLASSLPNSSLTALSSETSDLLMRRTSLSKTNFKPEKINSQEKKIFKQQSPMKKFSNTADHYELQHDDQIDNQQLHKDEPYIKNFPDIEGKDPSQLKQLVPSDEQHISNREICDFCLYDGEGNFTSYGYPLPYKANLNCSYRVQRVDEYETCALEIYFHEFDVPIEAEKTSALVLGTKNKADESASNECAGDYLEIQGRKFCGNGWTNKIETIPFAPEKTELSFKFQSDKKGSGKGFWLEVKRKLGSCYGRVLQNKKCEKRFSEMSFSMTSPQFPSNYANNLNCIYFVRKATPDVCGLELRFAHFDIESVNGCFYDFLEVKDEKLCGTMRSNTIKRLKFAIEEDQKQFTFHSDKQVGRSGFRIEVSQLTNCESIFDDDVNLDDSKLEQLPPPPSCNICTAEKHGMLTSYGYPMNYRNNLHCSYTIDKNNEEYCGLQLQFDDFNVAPSMGCEEDYLQINGEKFCGTTLHSTKKLINFKSISSSSNKNQIENSNENQNFHLANNSVQMVFHTNQIQSSKGFSITFQQIKCNSLDEDEEKSKINTSIENDNTARYSENKDQDDNNELLSQIVTSTPPTISNCEFIFNEKTFTLTSPNSTLNDDKNPTYPNNLACDYKIVQNSSRVCYLELKFIVFDVEASEKCQYDYLEVNNVRLCGTLQRQTTRTYIFNTYDKIIRFRTDGSTSRSGFYIDVEQLECIGDAIIRPSLPSLLNITNTINKNQDKTNHGTKNSYPSNKYPILPTKIPGYTMNTIKNNSNDLCVESFYTEEFDIFSPNFPISYPINSFCVYTINRSSANICKLEIKFMQFNIENSKLDICSADYLDIMGHKVCGSLGSGTLKQYDFPEDRNSLRIVFSANSLKSENDLGFYLRVKQISCIPNEQNLIPNQIPNTKTNMNSYTPINPVFSDNNLNGNCNEIHTESVFQLKSPNFPSSYIRNLNCVYKIIKKNPEVCSLEVHVIEFNVQPNLNKQSTSMMQKQSCGNEYLEFNGETICGRISPRAIRFFSFDKHEFIIKFRSGYTDLDNMNEKMGRAFLLQVRQKECSSMTENKNFGLNNPSINTSINLIKTYEGTKTKITQKPHTTISNNFEKIKQIEICDQSFNNQEFEIKYSVPLHKEPMENETKICEYTINKYNPAVCALKLVFNDIYQTDSSQINNCEKNYLQVTDTEKLCFDDSSKDKKIPFEENMKKIKLYLNTLTENPQRVFIKVNQIDCSPGENVINQQNTHTYPNSFNDQQNNLEMPNQENFVDQNSDKSMNTPVNSEDKTNLVFNDKPFDTPNFTMNSDLEIQKHQQSILNNETDFNQKHVSSISVENDFLNQLPPPSICELCYTELNGEIISYNYPAVYPKNLNCNYKITGQPNFCGVYLRFDVFTINNADTKSSMSPCVDDYLELNSVRYCGKQLENVKKILAFENSPKELSFRFISKKHTIGNGFKLNYMQIPCYLTPGQQSILNAMMTDYSSPSMINPQTSSTTSTSKQSVSKTNLVSNSMSKNTDLNHENQVQAQENEMNTDYQTFYSLSADPNPLLKKQNLPLFKTNYSTEKTSNDLNQASSIYSTPRLPCDQAIYDRFFEIRSPSYPFPYQSNLDCLYSIRRLSSNICKLRLYFVHFDLENDHNYKLIKDNHSLQRSLLHDSEACNEDYLEINEKIRFCGVNLNGTLRDFDFTSYKFPLRFRSNEEGSGHGFLIRGEQIRCIPSSFMFLNLENKHNNNQLVSSDSTLSTQEINDDNFNSNSGLDQTILMQKFYQMPSVLKNSTSYSSSSSATFQSPKQTSSTNSSFSNNLSNSISKSTSLNATESLNLLNPNKNEFTNEFNSMNSPFQWSIPNPPYTVSIKGQQVSINQYANNEWKNDLNKNNYGTTIPTNKMSTINDTQDSKQPVAADSQHTSSTVTQYNCNQIISDSVFELTSPYYPYRYDSNTRCLITIQKFKRSVCHLDLIFIKFDLGSTSNCESYTDYLSINGERFCGHYYSNRSYHFSTPDDVDRAVKVRTFRFDGPTLQMRFNGEIGTGYGFYLRGRQVECAVVGNDYLGRISEVVDTNHDVDSHHLNKINNHHNIHSHYDPHLHDHIVTVNHHSKIHDDNQHNLHHDNHFIVRDNEHPNHLLHNTLDRPAYHYHPDQYYNNLHKDNLTNFDHKSNTGYLNKGLNNTQHASNQTIHLRLDNKVLQHQDLNNTTNHYNYPPRVNLHHLTNNFQSNKNQQSNYTTNNITKHHHLQNNYNTNNYQTNNKANHDTSYNVSNYLINSNSLVGVPRSLSSLSHCDQIFSTNSFQLQSSNYPANYPNNIYCRYVIKRPNNATCAIDLTFVHFNLEEEDRCSKDYFEIDGAKICGSLPPYHQRRYYYFNGENEKILIFRSDLFINQPGFSIIGQQVANCNSYSTKIDNSPIRCDVNTDAVKGELISRNYPAPYDHNMQCTYKIRAADQRFCRLSLRIRDFDIKSNANCDDDYLYIDGERLCNSNLKKSEMTLYFPENNVARELQFNFYTNSIESGRGFYVEFLQELCIGNNLKYETNIGYMYPNHENTLEKKQFNQGRSINSETNNDDELRQQTISLREQKDKINKNSPPTYPPNYVARSNPVGEMIEATDINHQNEDLNNQTNLSNTNNFSDYHKRNHINHNVSQNESINRKLPSDKNFYSSSDNKSNSNSKMNYWAGNTILMKPTTSSESFMSKLKMGDQVLTSVKGKYEVIENKANKA